MKKYEIGDVVIDRTYHQNGELAILVGEGICQPIVLTHNCGAAMNRLGDGFSTWQGLEKVGHIDFEEIWKRAESIKAKRENQGDANETQEEPAGTKAEVQAIHSLHGRGEWVFDEKDRVFRCSNCGKESLSEDEHLIYDMELPNFCADCGADMRKERPLPSDKDRIIGIKKRLKYARKGRKISARDLADALGITTKCIYKWESEKNRVLPTAEHMAGFCLKCNVDANWLMFGPWTDE